MPSSHHKRILTSLLLIPILLSCLLTGGWFLFGLILVTTLLGLREFYGIFWKRGTHEVYKFTGYTAATALLLAGEYGAYDWMLYILAGTFWAASLVFLLRYGQHNDTICFTDTQVLTLGLFYLPVGLHFSFTLQPYELLLIICAALPLIQEATIWVPTTANTEYGPVSAQKKAGKEALVVLPCAWLPVLSEVVYLVTPKPLCGFGCYWASGLT